MNVKESHIVTGMSRDSSVSRQNPNLVYDALNIRITTKDGRNSVLSVTNERGTKQVNITSGSIEGTPIGSAILDNYIVIFTHKDTDYKDHIYKCKFTNDSVVVTTVFEGDAGFDLAYPLETLPIFETENIQKVYWVDGIHQPRFINIIRDNAETNADKLNFSREVSLTHDPISVTKSNSGGTFPTGTIQYMFSYYDLYGQETRLIDISPMYYLSPKEKGATADSLVPCSFVIKLNNLDGSFNYVRIYAIIRTQEDAIPQARCLGDFPMINVGGVYKLEVIDNGIIGRTIEAASLYFLGGEECIASTIAQKDNTLFLGNIQLTRPNIGDIKYDNDHTLADKQNTNDLATASPETLGYSEESTELPHTTQTYYDYNINNNRSSYYIKRFKYKENYRLGFIAQYKNGQWSEPLWIDDKVNNIKPNVEASSYSTGAFSATINSIVVNKLISAGYKRVAPVVVYPQPTERNIIAQGVTCPTVYNERDRNDNSPYIQSSWFFRFNRYSGNNYSLRKNLDRQGEIQCLDVLSTTNDMFKVDAKYQTFHSPDIECSLNKNSLDMNNLKLYAIAYANANSNKIINKYVTLENVGINPDKSQVINISFGSIFSGSNAYDYFTNSFPMYCDGLYDTENDEEVERKLEDAIGWVIYPWQREGSLNNQRPLSTKQKQNGFTNRTAVLKRNITANYYFTKRTNLETELEYTLASNPVLFDSDQLTAVKVNKKIYYGNIDKVLTPSGAGYYYIRNGWVIKKDDLKSNSPETKAINAIKNGYNGEVPSDPTIEDWWNTVTVDGTTCDSRYMAAIDPVSMKYKSTPHLVIPTTDALPSTIGPSKLDTTYNPTFRIAELRRISDPFIGTGSYNGRTTLQWIRCGDSERLDSDTDVTVHYKQGDCYVQRYDCLKTYPFTNEDTNSVIELLSVILETYVNLDFRTDSNRGGSNNVAISPFNFNLFNHSAYEQTGNFFVYRMLDYSTKKTNVFNNVVTYSLEKHAGEDVDTWTSIDLNNTLDLDGAMGSLTKLINYNNDIYAFQSSGFAKLLFNNRVQIPTSDNIPIEITNGMKMQGKQYISTKIGCTNKWSIVETPLGLYFIDDILRTAYMFNGQLQDLSTTKGMKSWMNDSCNNSIWDVQNFGNCRAFYDKVGKDIYWIYDDIALVYSEILGQYMSFMSYGGVPLLESINEGTYAITGGVSARNHAHIRIPTVNNNIHEDTTLSFLLDSNYNKVVNLSVGWETESSNQESTPQEAPRRSANASATNPYSTWDVLPFTKDDDEQSNISILNDISLLDDQSPTLIFCYSITSVSQSQTRTFFLKGHKQGDAAGTLSYFRNDWTFENYSKSDYIEGTRPRDNKIFYNRDDGHYYNFDRSHSEYGLINMGGVDPTTWNLSVDESSLNFAAGGEGKQIVITSNISWEIITNQVWVTASPSSGSNGATITVTANPNTNTYQRNAQLTIRGTGVYQGVELTISISQDAAQPIAPYLTVSPQVLGFGKSSESKIFSISSNTSWSLSMLEPSISWMHVSENSGTGDGQITVSVDANENTDSRQATIVVTDGDSLTRTIVVAQSGNANWSQFSVSPITLSFAGTGEMKTISLTCDFDWEIVKNVSGLEIDPYSGSGSENAQTIEVTVAPNNTTSIRQTTIELIGGGISQTITISQEAGTSNAADVIVTSTETTDTVQVTLYTCEYISSNAYTIGDLLDALREKLPEFLNALVDKPNTYSLEYKDKDYYDTLSTSLFNSNSVPLWKLNAGNYNEFFGVHKPYYLTLISNGYPTQNKIFNTVEWRDIVKDEITTKPFHTFDHIRVWTENQDTQSVRFSNSLSQDSSRQPISYNAAVSNLRKKFNVWRAQIPRDKIALNTNRARISNPWCYIKLSREDPYTERHEIMDIEVDFFM